MSKVINVARLPSARGKWVDRWAVESSSGKTYVVARNETEWGCTCPHWKFRRLICSHIKYVQQHHDGQQAQIVSVLIRSDGTVRSIDLDELPD